MTFVELADLWEQIVFRATIVVGLSIAFGILALIALVVGVVWMVQRWRTTESVEEHTDMPEYDEAA